MRHGVCLVIRFLLLSGIIISPGRCQKQTEQQRLYDSLLLHYNKYERPVKDPKWSIRLSFIFELIKVYEVNAKKQRMGVLLVLSQEWKDYHLRWNSTDYNGFSSINIPPARIWVPDVGLYNEIANKDHKKTDIAVKVMVSSDGTCRWSVPMFYQVLCSVDVSFFPLDLQECSLSFGSLAYTASEIFIKQGKLANSSNYIKNGEWLLYKKTIKTSVTWDDIRQNNFTVVEVALKLERNSFYYVVEMFVPCLLISGLTILGFILPPESGERMSLGMLILLAMTFFQQLTMKMFPLQNFPLISRYLLATTIEIGIALLLTTLTINFYYCKDKQMPKILKIIILDFLGKITKLRPVAGGKKSKKTTSFRSNLTNTEMHFDIELIEAATCQNPETGNERLNSSSVGLVYYKRGSETSSSCSNISSNNNETKEEPVADENPPPEWNEDWVLAARIIDRFAIYAAVLIGTITILGLFLQSPKFWRKTTDMEL